MKIGKNSGKKGRIGVEKRRGARGANIIFGRGGGNKYSFRTKK
jgi:hypothetical protein